MSIAPQSSLTASYDSLVKAQDVNFRQRLDEQGKLVKGKLSGGVRGKLVAFVASGRVSEGSVAHRMIRCAVGGAQRYDAIVKDLRDNKEASIRNFAGMLKQELRLDKELARLVERKVTSNLGNRRISAQAGADLARDIAGMVSQRRADRQEIANRVLDRDNWTMTPAMVTNTNDEYSEPSWLEARIAYARISEKDSLMPHRIQTTDTVGMFREGRLAGRADLMVKEMQAVERALRTPPELLAKQDEKSALLAAEQPRGAQDDIADQVGRLNSLEAQIAAMSNEAEARAASFKTAYLDMLAAIHDDALYGDKGANFNLPTDAEGTLLEDGNTVAHEPGGDPYSDLTPLLDAGRLSPGTAEFFGLPRKLPKPIIKKPATETPGQAEPPAAKHNKSIRWSDEPVQVKRHELGHADKTYRADKENFIDGDPELGDIKSYNRRLFSAGKGKMNYDLDNTLLGIRELDGEGVSVADEKELLRVFGIACKITHGYDGKNRIKGVQKYEADWRTRTPEVKELLNHPLLEPAKIVGYIEKQVYAPPSGAAMRADGSPARVALRSHAMADARLCLGGILHGPAGTAADQQRAAGLLRTLLQDAVAEAGKRPLDAESVKAYKAELAVLAQDWPHAEPVAAQNAAAHIEVVRDCVNQTRDAFTNEILNKDRSLREVAEFLAQEQGDKALRKLTVGLEAIRKGTLAVHHLPVETLNGEFGLGDFATVGQWREQSEQVAGLAGMIAAAQYSDELPGKFNEYCASGRQNAFNRLASPDLPARHDQGLRAWLKQGHELTERLLVAQEGAGKGALPLTSKDLADLQAAVADFANPARRGAAGTAA